MTEPSLLDKSFQIIWKRMVETGDPDCFSRRQEYIGEFLTILIFLYTVNGKGILYIFDFTVPNELTIEIILCTIMCFRTYVE
jgi:hypothetical protein